jgi:predicted permease
MVVAIVLLVACANVASLLLARGRARARELTVRVAVGAPRARVVRQLLTEGLLLAAFGSALGLAFAQWIASALLPALATIERATDAGLGLDLRLVGFVAVLASACAVLFSLAPALRATRVSLVAGLQEGGRGSGAAARQRGGLSAALVIGQIALSMVLLTTAVLLIRSVRQLQHVELGFNPRNVVIFRIDPSLNGYDESRIRQVYSDILGRLRANGSVANATLSSHTLISNSSSIGVARRPNEIPPERGSAAASPFMASHQAWRLIVDPAFFATLELPVVRGRSFDSRDTEHSQKVAVINRAMAQQLFQSEDVLGRQFRLGMLPDAPLYEIVGISADARYTSVRGSMRPTIYLAFAQQPAGAATFEVKAAGDPAMVAAAAREAVRAIDSSLPLLALRLQEEQVVAHLSQEILFARLAALLGAVTLALSAIGLYALLAYGVTRRTPEIGIRMALGAGRRTVRWMILKQSLVLAAWGLAFGVGGALAGTKLVQALLYEVPARDPLAIGGAAAMMLGVSLLAGYLPARRAARVDPLVALRQ